MTTQFFQGYATPKPFFIERQGETFKVTYTTVETSKVGTHYCSHFVGFFGSYEAALAVVNGMIEFFQWMSGLSAAIQEVRDLFLNEEIAQAETLVGGVIFYTDLSDKSERLARLLEVSKERGYKLADPAYASDFEWYPFQQIADIQIGRQHEAGWY